ncbi:type IV toxin-antitoxin system AbiEi family antitoxin domain-containing protein [Actinoplanes regularis]|uniref:Transcriptional regulator, AbiEi antitoxin, Type IV TA system n=1 Tax=Actinoplanes regularis TaxID=52697 RepID=A0A238V325_9ACTN|nr:type IV toxin-antitoxin system AbiEi family antitoxin domain-containing protein [Actinoplanes regularis]GIE83983.1 hypothetical protein Are01nite_04630 [Actinoplanes regularis]SNR28830.1 Transcriptional regulator, AbiEi antitoxin, Type IV TA system [Actinoplanes regularis]
MAQLDETTRRQHGVVTRQQALQGGISADVLHRRVRTGRWQRLMPGIYATFSGRPPPAAARWAAILYSGPGAMLCHRSAAEEAGLAEPGPGAVHVLIPERRRVRPASGVVVHRSRHAKARRHPHRRPPQTRLEETVLDLASASADAEEALHWITTACARRLTTPDRIAHALQRRTRLARRREVTAVLANAAGHTSALPRWPTVSADLR